jgi:hypothetical protein
MRDLPIDRDKFARDARSPLVEATLSLVRELARDGLAKADSWADFAGRSEELVTASDIAGVERRILASGYRFDWSAASSVAERPEAYKPAAGVGEDAATFSFEHAEAVTAEPDGDGRRLSGQGDNVVRHAANAVGTARYIRTNDRVLSMLTDGVPPGTIAIIDDSGGTLTAPIIDQFVGVICAGGTVRSHLGILTREYGIPCLMNAKISGIREGDTVEMETTVTAKTTEDYQAGRDVTGRVWRIES